MGNPFSKRISEKQKRPAVRLTNQRGIFRRAHLHADSQGRTSRGNPTRLALNPTAQDRPRLEPPLLIIYFRQKQDFFPQLQGKLAAYAKQQGWREVSFMDVGWAVGAKPFPHERVLD